MNYWQRFQNTDWILQNGARKDNFKQNATITLILQNVCAISYSIREWIWYNYARYEVWTVVVVVVVIVVVVVVVKAVLRHDTVLLAKYLPMFWKSLVPSYLGNKLLVDAGKYERYPENRFCLRILPLQPCSHGHNLQTFEQCLHIVLCVYNV